MKTLRNIGRMASALAISVILYFGLIPATEAKPKGEISKTDTSFIQHKPRLADRFFVYSVLNHVFGPRAADFTQDTIMRYGSPLGGPCDIYEQIRIGEKISDVKDPLSLCPNGKAGSRLPMIPTDSTVREGRLSRACKELSEDKEALTYAAQKSKALNFESDISESTIQNVYRLFDPSFDLDLQQTKKLFSNLSSLKIPNKQKWQILLQTTCSNSFWQIL